MTMGEERKPASIPHAIVVMRSGATGAVDAYSVNVKL
jgi:hypothetical protein